jgi:hypothetical protein
MHNEEDEGGIKKIPVKRFGSWSSIAMFVYYLSSTLKHQAWSIFKNYTLATARKRYLRD